MGVVVEYCKGAGGNNKDLGLRALGLKLPGHVSRSTHNKPERELKMNSCRVLIGIKFLALFQNKRSNDELCL